MDLKDIMAIAGKPGLYKFVAQGRNAIIVEQIESGKRTSAFTTERINSLEEITVFTKEKDKPLKEVFKAIFEKENGKEAISSKSDNKTLKDYFEEVMPDYDRDRVYVSDIKKILQWYNILQKAEMLSFEEEEKGKTEETEGKKETGETGETGETKQV
jgi:sulfatase maturation enzyme AslB (radical SAM superfamily)